jgi:hypothetical protein
MDAETFRVTPKLQISISYSNYYQPKGRGNVVGTAIAYGLDDQEVRVRAPVA